MHKTTTLQEHKWKNKITKGHETASEINISLVKNRCKSGLNIQRNTRYFEFDGKRVGNRNKCLEISMWICRQFSYSAIIYICDLFKQLHFVLPLLKTVFKF